MDKVISRTISEIEKVKNENLELNDKLNKVREENEQIKKDFAKLHIDFAKCNEENELLKKQYNCYACDSCGGKEDYINMKRHTENAIKTVHKYRQALQEIKKYIAKICKEECGYVQKKRCPDSDCRYGQILAKINEVIGANQ